ncbi:MAG: hypothetical protein DID92_2727745566 [Candidatus Nitrotoga sp. SPKER]|nr:MAG: hypothetical protein DID92_2727745566 [Candidatus Nitrotoga sp. SPKER]
MAGRDNPIGRIFVVQKQVEVPGRSNKSKLAVNLMGQHFCYTATLFLLILGMWYCFDVFSSRD